MLKPFKYLHVRTILKILIYNRNCTTSNAMFIDVGLKFQIAVAYRSNFCLNCWSSTPPRERFRASRSRYALTTCETAAKSLVHELDPLLKHSNTNRARFVNTRAKGIDRINTPVLKILRISRNVLIQTRNYVEFDVLVVKNSIKQLY